MSILKVPCQNGRYANTNPVGVAARLLKFEVLIVKDNRPADSDHRLAIVVQPSTFILSHPHWRLRALPSLQNLW
jgi:hypothetical protein